MARRRNQSPEEQEFNNILKDASKSFKKDAEELYDNIKKQNRELKSLLQQRVSASKEDKKRIDRLISDSQRSLDESFDTLNSGVASFWEQWTEEEKKAYTDRLDQIEDESKALKKTIKAVRGELVNSIEDAEEAIKSQQKSLAETVNDFSERMRDWADTFNLSAIRSSLEESVDSFVKNRRELESVTGEWFDGDKFSDAVSQSVKDLASYNRNEASEFISEFVKEFALSSQDQISQYSTELMAQSKVFGASLSDLGNIFWRDQNGSFEGRLSLLAGNLASELSTGEGLNVKGLDVLTSINENIDTIFGAHSKNERTQRKLMKSVASIETLQATAANTGITQLSDSITEWSKMSVTGLMRDDAFQTFSRTSGISAFDFQEILESGDITQLFTRFQEGLNRWGSDNEYQLQSNLQSFADQMGWDYSQVRDLYDADSEGIKNIIDSINLNGEEADQVTDQGISDTVLQEDKIVGAVEEFKNDMSDFFKPVIDFFSGFDISLTEVASMITVGATAAKGIAGFLGIGGGVGGLKGLLSGVLGIGGSGGGLLGSLLGGGATAGASGLVGGASGALGGATGALGGVGGTVGGAVTAGGGIVSTVASGIGTLVSTGGPIAGGLMAVADSVGGLSNSVSWLGEEDGKSLSGKFASAVGGAIGGTDSGLTGGLKGAAKGALIGAFAGPVGMAVGGAIGAVAGAVGGEKIAKMAKTAFDFIGEVGGKFFSAVGGFAKAVGSGVKKVFNGIADFGHDVFENAVEGFDTLLRGTGKFAESIGKGVGTILKGGGQLAKGIGKGIGSILGGFGSGAGRFAEGVGKGFGNVLEGVSDLAEGVGKGLGSIISAGGDLAEGIGKGLGDIVAGAGDFAEGVGKGLGSMIEGLGGFAEGVGKGIGNVFIGLGTGIKEIAEGVGSGIGSIFIGAGQGLGAFAEGIGSGIGSVVSAGGDLADGIGKGIGSIVSASGDLAEGVGQGIGNVVLGLGDFAESIGSGIGLVFEGMSTFASGVGEGIGNVITASGDLAEGIGTGIGNVLSGGGDLAEGIGRGIGGVFSGAGQGIGMFAQGIGEGLGGVLSGSGDFVEGIGNALGGALGGLGEGAKSVLEGAGSAAGSVIDSVLSGVNDFLFGDNGRVELDLSGITQTGNPIIDNLTYILAYTKYIAENMGNRGSGNGETTERRYGGLVGLVQDIFGGALDVVGNVVSNIKSGISQAVETVSERAEAYTDWVSNRESIAQQSVDEYNKWVSENWTSAPMMAEGSSRISNDGLAYLHKDEAVLTKGQANFVRDKADGGIDISGVLGNTFRGINSVFGFNKSYQSANSSEQFIKELVQSKLSGDSVTDQAVITQLADDIGMSYRALYDLVYKDDQQVDSITNSLSKQSDLVDEISTLDFKDVKSLIEDANKYFKDANKIKASSGGSSISKLIKSLFGNSAMGKSLEKMFKGQSNGSGFFSRLASKLGNLSGGGSGATGSNKISGASGSLGGGGGSGDSGSSGGGTTKLAGNSTTDKIFKYLKNELNLNNAGAAGVLGNLQRESGFDTTAVGDGGTSYGIVQWHNNRWTNLKNFASQKGKDQSDLGVQLDFMKYELKSNGWPGVYNDIKSVPNTLEGAKKASEVWVRRYEMPNDIENEVAKRNEYTSNWWDKYKSYAVGTPWIPDDQVALIHEGEMIVPADQNPMNDVGSTSIPIGSNNNEFEVIEVMKWQIYRLEAKLDKLITTVASTKTRIKRDYSSEISDTDLAFASVRSSGTGYI